MRGYNIDSIAKITQFLNYNFLIKLKIINIVNRGEGKKNIYPKLRSCIGKEHEEPKKGVPFPQTDSDYLMCAPV